MPSNKTKRSPARAEVGATSTDAFLGGRINIVQPHRGHRAGSDAVFLAAAVPADAKGLALDVGAGVGVAGLCLLARVPSVTVTAVEIDPALCQLAEANAARNGFAESFKVVNADVTWPAKKLTTAGLVRETYDQVIANPPFREEGAVRTAPSKAAAHVMRAGELAVWIRFLTAMTAPKGFVSLIYPSEHLGALLRQLDGRFGDVRIFPLFPKANTSATRVILQGRKGSRAAPRLLPGLVLHDSDGRYTDAAEAVLRGGEALRL
ncbi:MAG: tRNA1(Val) (adenine(37)-N6)-methyltransferase [Methyloceanibacter sp.]